MKISAKNKLHTVMQKLSEVMAQTEDRTEKQALGDALEHLIVAYNDPPATKIPLPHNVTLTVAQAETTKPWPTVANRA
jgi:hypothetical protein